MSARLDLEELERKARGIARLWATLPKYADLREKAGVDGATPEGRETLLWGARYAVARGARRDAHAAWTRGETNYASVVDADGLVREAKAEVDRRTPASFRTR